MSDQFHEPGSPAAIAEGCTCPPQTWPDLIYDKNCPIHAAGNWTEPCSHGHIEPNQCPACNPD